MIPQITITLKTQSNSRHNQHHIYPQNSKWENQLRMGLNVFQQSMVTMLSWLSIHPPLLGQKTL
jgi:hypothetical protein